MATKRVEVEIVATDEASPKLEQVEKKMEGLEADPVTIKADTTGLDNLGKSADSSKSVLANMVGNSTQDLGALGGVAGSAGVAIGQMGEYMVDASNSGDKLSTVFSNFATVAGPIAALAVTMQTLSDITKRFADSAARTAENQEAWTDALLDGGDAAETYGEHLKDLGAITLDLTREQSKLEGVISEIAGNKFLGGGFAILADKLGLTSDETKDLTASFAKARIEVDEWTAIIAGSESDQAGFVESLKATSLSAEEQADIVTALKQSVEDYDTAVKNAAARKAVFGIDLEVPSDADVQSFMDKVQAALDKVPLKVNTTPVASNGLNLNPNSYVPAATVVNNWPPGTPPPQGTQDSLGTYLTRNSARTGG